MSCPICGQPCVVSYYRRRKTCGDEECLRLLRSRNILRWYATEAGQQVIAKRQQRYSTRISAEVWRVIREVAGDAEMISRRQVARIGARLRRTGYLHGYHADWIRRRREHGRVA